MILSVRPDVLDDLLKKFNTSIDGVTDLPELYRRQGIREVIRYLAQQSAPEGKQFKLKEELHLDVLPQSQAPRSRGTGRTPRTG